MRQLRIGFSSRVVMPAGVLGISLLAILLSPGSLLADSQYERRNQLIQRLNVDINFYGIVLDEYDQPLDNVTIAYSVHRGEVGRWGAKIDRGRLRTGPEGLFTISPGKGHKLEILKIVKSGYKFDYMPSFLYSHIDESKPVFVPDESNPIVIKPSQR